MAKYYLALALATSSASLVGVISMRLETTLIWPGMLVSFIIAFVTVIASKDT